MWDRNDEIYPGRESSSFRETWTYEALLRNGCGIKLIILKKLWSNFRSRIRISGTRIQVYCVGIHRFADVWDKLVTVTVDCNNHAAAESATVAQSPKGYYFRLVKRIWWNDPYRFPSVRYLLMDPMIPFTRLSKDNIPIR